MFPATSRPNLSASALAIFSIFVTVGFAAWAGITFTTVTARVATIWLANGLVVATLLCQPRRLWFLVVLAGFFGNFAANILTGDAPTTALVLCVVNSIEIIVSALLLYRMLGAVPDLSDNSQRLRFVGGACIAAPSIAATLAARYLSQAEIASFKTMWEVWFAADSLGMLVTVPMTLQVLRGELRRLMRPGCRLPAARPAPAPCRDTQFGRRHLQPVG